MSTDPNTPDAGPRADTRAHRPSPEELSGALVVAIDGPAGSGKSTVAARVAERLGIEHLDTGAMYRAVTLACLDRGVDLDDGLACAEVARSVEVVRVDGVTYLDGDDVEDVIRGEEVTAAVSRVAAHPGVRDAMTPLQRTAAEMAGGVVEGRDIGTVVLPDADLKVFLTASVEERARRRAAQLGVEPETIVDDIRNRDEQDGRREVAPLVPAEDAWELDTTGMTLDEVVDAIVARAEELARIAADPVAARRSLPRIAVVGRPNVGKSTLVNRILGERVAIVEEKPGVTRDRTEHRTRWTDREFVLVDTGGWEHGAEGMSARIVEQAEAAIDQADLVLFVVDVTVGALDDDERYAKLIRRSGTPSLLVVNKVDSELREPEVHALYTLGLGEPHPVSARHGRGVGDLLDEALALLPPAPVEVADESLVPHVAIVGKPNVGKSSLFNRLLGEERSIVDDVPHTTRDAVDTMVEIDGQPWVFVDTAGMRRRYRTGEDTELYSVDRTRRAIELADLVLFVIDASEPLGEQDQRLAALLREAGRGVVLVCNQWDEVDEERRHDLERELDRMLGFLAWAPRVNISALTGRGVRRVVPHLTAVWEQYRRRIGSAELARWLEETTTRTPPPTRGGRTTRIRFVTQVESRPPLFLAFVNGELTDAYRRYLERELRARYGFLGVPLKIEDRVSRRRERRRR
ncbi:MAG: ribosome biogenesis GTPase Der [Actinomycetes bacterium]